MLIGYARISTDTQVLDQQIDALKRYGVDERFIFKEQISSSVKHRPELEKALAFLHKDDTFVVVKLDRFGRSLQYLIQKLQEFKACGIHFVSITENINTTSATGNLQFQIIAAFAEFERGLISERTIEALKAAKERGKKLGHPPILTLEQKSMIDQLLKDGTPKMKIARTIGIKSVTPIYNYIKTFRAPKNEPVKIS